MPELPLALLRAATATPSPTPTYDPDSITPGFAGFVAIALLAVVVIFLIVVLILFSVIFGPHLLKRLFGFFIRSMHIMLSMVPPLFSILVRARRYAPVAASISSSPSARIRWSGSYTNSPFLCRCSTCPRKRRYG